MNIFDVIICSFFLGRDEVILPIMSMVKTEAFFGDRQKNCLGAKGPVHSAGDGTATSIRNSHWGGVKCIDTKKNAIRLMAVQPNIAYILDPAVPHSSAHVAFGLTAEVSAGDAVLRSGPLATRSATPSQCLQLEHERTSPTHHPLLSYLHSLASTHAFGQGVVTLGDAGSPYRLPIGSLCGSLPHSPPLKNVPLVHCGLPSPPMTGWRLSGGCWGVADSSADAATIAFQDPRAQSYVISPRVKESTAENLTHSHIDHFGGIFGVLSRDAAERGDVQIVAPAGFLHEATSENLLAGIAMTRRAGLMYGMPLPRNERGHLDSGLGKEPARGRVGLLPPTDLVDRTPQEMEIDGIRFVFQYAPESEAPAELTFYLPHANAYCGAEIVSHTMHNLYTLRGAKVRDALRWSGYIDEAIDLFADAEVVFASHHWPIWGNAEVIAYLKRQRDTYKFVHDQTLRLANSGFTPREIAEQLELPESLRTSFANRGYYGTVRHNSKAVYQWYFGWYDGNPANLDPLPPEEAGARYVEFMGGADEVRRKATEA